MGTDVILIEMYECLVSAIIDSGVRQEKIRTNINSIRNAVLDVDDTKGISLLAIMLEISDEDINTQAVKIFEDNYESILKRVETTNQFCANSIKLIGNYLDKTSSENRNVILLNFQKKLVSIVDADCEPFIKDAIIEHSIEYGDDGVKEKALVQLRKSISNLGSIDRNEKMDMVNNENVETNVVKLLLNSQKSETLFVVLQSIDNHLRSFGLEGHELMGFWRSACKSEKFDMITVLNISTINDLEKKQQGITKKLVNYNKIHNFARYPMELLFQQDKLDDKESFFQIVTSDQDREGTFYNFHNYSFYKMLINNLPHRYGVQIFEVSPKFPELPTDAPESNWGMLQIHGERTKIMLGFDYNDNPVMIQQEDVLDNPRLLGLSKLRKGSRLLLSSCSTGYIFESANPSEVSIGLSLSETLGILICAPSQVAGLKGANLVDKGKGFVILPDFVTRGYDNLPVKITYAKDGSEISRDEYLSGDPDIWS